MCDQLRWDYLSCYGHPHLQTPNIDRLAARGVRFNRAYVQSPLCCPSRASFYTGRYMSSHGCSINFAPIRPDELGIGDYLAPLGVRTALVGKTHSIADLPALRRLGIDPDSAVGSHLANISFEPYWRDDGLHPNDDLDENIAYNRYLREQGYNARNGWQQHANGARDEAGEWVNGWFLRAGTYPADIEEAHSETPYATRRAMAFIEDAGDQPWCLHLSYIKPHWPFIVPAPYHNMYGPEQFLPIVRDASELDDAHPIFAAFTKSRPALGFQNPAGYVAALQAYMGLIKQIDDQIGHLMNFLTERGELDKTVIVFTSDHGDYLGDHWLGEKSFFHDCSVRVPLIVVDPSPAADSTRGSVSESLVETIDLLPTFVDMMGGVPAEERLEGHSLLPLLHDKPVEWRQIAVSETDFSDRFPRYHLDVDPQHCNAVMLVSKRWKYIAFDSFRPMLFDLEHDPQELVDLGDNPDYANIRQEMQDELVKWLMRRKTRVTVSTAQIDEIVGGFNRERRGILIGYYDEAELEAAMKTGNRG